MGQNGVATGRGEFSCSSSKTGRLHFYVMFSCSDQPLEGGLAQDKECYGSDTSHEQSDSFVRTWRF
ncbi:hypothetical protein [Peribacillus saganii]|uniref:hypothetical protein n=1 Tax=Peribacillus saganii TaxID=2303992 RepID=UPI0013148A12|nr:hypothetical protein [Peribacillus saganii]